MPGYKKSELGIIPEDWEVINLNEKARIIDSLHQTPSFSENGYPMVRVTDIKTGNLSFIGSLTVTEDVYKEFTKSYKPKRGDIVLSRVGSYGISSFVETDEQFCMGQNTVVIEPKLSSRFLYYILNSRNIRQQIEDGSYGSGYKSLSLKNIKELLIPVPSTDAEQINIAVCISDVDALLDLLDKLITKKRDLKKAAMQQLFTGQTRLSGFSGKLEIKRLGDLISHCFSGATPRRNRPEFYKGDIRWITSGELNYNVITDTIEKISNQAVIETNLTIHPVGTFLMAITGLEAEGTRGSCGIVGAPAATNQSCMAVFPIKERLMVEYLFHYYVFHGKSLAMRYCQGTKQQSYTAGLVRQLPIILPTSIDEQAEIAHVLSDMDKDLYELQVRREKTAALKQGMMQELLTGKTRLI